MDELQFRVKECAEIVSCEYPCRSDIIHRLFVDLNLGREHPTALPASVFIYGDHGTGKTAVLSEFLQYLPHRSVTIDCVESYTPKIIFETVLNELFEHQLLPENNYASYMKCENGRDFIDALAALPVDQSYVIRFDDAQRLRDMEAYVLSIFLRLRECTKLNVCCLFVSTLPFEKLFPIGSFPLPIVVHWPNYTQKDILTILLASYPSYSKRLYDIYVHALGKDTEDKVRRADVIDGLERNFYENFFNILLNTFYRTCRDLNELRLVSLDCFIKYCEPILESNLDPNDVRTLYKNIASTLKATVNTIYRRVDHITDAPVDGVTATRTQQLELPYYAKFLLIAAFLASHNDAKLDKRLFVKHHGKQRKTQHTIKARQMISERMATQLGPKSFPIDRLMAIFYSIVEEKVPLTCNLMAQIPSLVRLKLLHFVTSDSNIMDGTARMQCIVSLEFILQIGRNVGFNVRQYLGDFM